MNNSIKIKGARANNLKNISLEIPRGKFTVITGISGSGKSSLAFDTIYAEGRRRYVESLSSYARQFIGQMDKPDVDSIEGLSPAISIDQKSSSNNPRSTVGTITEIYDYTRLLYARIGDRYCPECGGHIKPSDASKIIKISDGEKKSKNKEFTKFFLCPLCGIKLPEIEPRNFSFNSPRGACAQCSGLGSKLEIDPELLVNPNLTIAQGAIRAWAHGISGDQNRITRELETAARPRGFDLNTPVKNLEKKQLDFALYGSAGFEGIIPNLENRFRQTESDYVRKEIEQYMKILVCPSCGGKRLKPEMLAVKIAGLSIHDISEKTIGQAKEFFRSLADSKTISERNKKISAPIIKEILARLECLSNVGLNYLAIGRPAASLSGGESQRIRLATQIGSALTGVTYILDEPSIGLHQKDNNKLILALKKLRDLENTVIAVEHDEATMLAADWLIDIGPGAGEHGGKVVAQGSPQNIKQNKKSLTGRYLSGEKSIQAPLSYRAGNGKKLKIIKAGEHNLKNIDVEFPLGSFIAVTGVSGSGKSTLMTDILANALNRKFYRAKQEPGKHEAIHGLENIDKVISINQSPIGRTPRSNPATYTGAFTYIRDLFASIPEAKIRGYKTGRFSFNASGGRCEACGGGGMVKIEMQFLPDVYIECETCGGKRYNKETLEIKFKEKNIYDALDMTVEQGLDFFKDIPAIEQKLSTLSQVGLGYVKLGQSATTLSGGEAQRIKLAAELSRRATGKTLYILDEPTTGLHFDDIKKLLHVLNRLVDKGNTVLIIEHNLDVIKSVDWVIDLGPEGGDKGGEIVAAGNPRQIAENKKSQTGKYLAKILN